MRRPWHCCRHSTIKPSTAVPTLDTKRRCGSRGEQSTGNCAGPPTRTWFACRSAVRQCWGQAAQLLDTWRARRQGRRHRIRGGCRIGIRDRRPRRDRRVVYVGVAGHLKPKRASVEGCLTSTRKVQFFRLTACKSCAKFPFVVKGDWGKDVPLEPKRCYCTRSGDLRRRGRHPAPPTSTRCDSASQLVKISLLRQPCTGMVVFPVRGPGSEYIQI